MEMFNVHRRDILNFDNYMDLKKPGFGGPSSAVAFKDKSGKRVVDNPKLKEFQRVVERDPMFASRHYDSTYKAMTHDVIYKQEKKKPVKYRDPYLTALPVIDMSKVTEGYSHTNFSQFVLEQGDPMGGEFDDDPMEGDFSEEPDDFYDEDVPPADEEDFAAEPSTRDIDDIERMLKSFEEEDEDYED